jgi:hypothetical protein
MGNVLRNISIDTLSLSNSSDSLPANVSQKVYVTGDLNEEDSLYIKVSSDTYLNLYKYKIPKFEEVASNLKFASQGLRNESDALANNTVLPSN